MKVLLFAALALIVIAEAARSEERCLFEPTKSTTEAACLHVELPPAVAPTTVTTVSVDPARVAAMPPLPQPVYEVKEVAAE